MTWQYLLRTAAVSVFGLVVLAVTESARAEGGEDSTLVPANMMKSEEAASVATSVESEQEASAASTKPAKGGSKTAAKAITPNASGAKQANAASAAQEEIDVEQTASISIAPVEESSLRRRSGDEARANAIRPLIARYATEHGLPYDLADAIVRLESRYNPAARRGANVGLTQINFQTARSLGYQGDTAGLLDAETNLRYGLKYLAQAYKLAGGDICGAILRYQFGHRAQSMNGTSRAYCAKVKAFSVATE